MIDALLTSERFVKAVTSISDNIAGKYILPSIREVQESKLRNILGNALLERLKRNITPDFNLDFSKDYANGFEYAYIYRDILRQSQYFLAYSAVVEVAFKVSFKVANLGVIRTADENVQSVTAAEVGQVQDYWQNKADEYCHNLQTWLLEHRDCIPDLDEAQCCRLRANLKSAASCGVWLGGPRGKVRRRGCR